jgi:fibronectin-binding autotransporter adhesin
MAVTRINNNQITDASAGNVYLGINANAKLQNYSITSNKIANNLTYGSDLTVSGNLTVNGTSTAIDTTITTIEDPVIVLASLQTGSPAVDIGFLGERGTANNIAFVWDESAGEFVTAFTDTSETNTTINIIGYADIHTKDANIGGNAVINGTTSLVGNLIGAVNATGNITGGNLLTAGLVSATGTITSNSNISGANILTGGIVSATSTITGGNLATGGDVSATGNITGGNIISGNAVIGNINVSGNIAVNSLTSNTFVSASGNVIGGNVTTGGSVSATGTITSGDTITGGNLATGGTASAGGNVTGANILTGGLVSATATITGGNLATGGTVSAVGNVTGGNINTAGTSSATGNVTGGNILTSGLVSATGAVIAGSLETSGTANATGTITGGNISTGGFLSAVGTATVGNLATAGTVSAGGNITGANILTGGLISSTGTVTAGNIATGGTVSATGTITGGNLATGGEVSATGNITASASGFFIGNGSQLTGVVASSANAETLTGTFLAVNVVDSSLTSVGVLGNLSVAGNTVSGNLATAGTASVTGTITGGNVATGGTVSATGDITGGNIATGGTASATGTITGGNLATGGTVSATGTATAGNIATGGTVSATATITGGNIATAGTVSATGDITGGNIATGGTVSATGTATAGNIATGGTASAAGNITGANILTGGIVSATGNITGGNVNAPQVYGSSTLTLRAGTGNINLETAGNVVVNNTYINNLAQPVQNQDAATKLYVDNAVTTAISYHEAVVAATTTTLATATGGTITYAQPNGVANGVGATLTTTGTFNLIDTANVQTAGTRILVKDQANAVQNGVYVYSNATVITRASSEDTYGPASADALSINDYFFVSSGSVNAGSAWIVDAPAGTITFGTSNIQFAQFSSSQVYSANTAAGLSLIGTVFSAKVDNDTTAFDGLGNISVKAGANLTTPNIGAATGTSLSTTGTVTGGNLATGGTVSATGTITGGNLVTGGTASVTGTATLGNVDTAGTVSATGTITGGNLATGGTASVTGTVTGGNLATGGTVSAAGTVTGGNLDTGGTISGTGTVTGGNIATGGTVSATGTATLGNVATGGTISATGTITGGNLATGGTVSAAGNITAGTGSYFLGDGSLLTGVAAASVNAGNLVGNTLSSNVTFSSLTSVGNLTALSVVGTTQTGNLQTAGIVSATGDVTGGNIVTGGTVSATGTATVGNLATGGTVSATGTATAGNVLTGGLVSATGNVTGANIVTGGLVTSTGNVTGGNILTAGIVSSTGTITGGNLETGGTASVTGTATVGNVATGGTISATGTVTGGNIATGGTVSATGNVTAGNILSGGSGSFTGNITAANFIGNISGNVSAPGANTQVEFNDNGITNATAGFTFDKTSNTVTVGGQITSTGAGNTATNGGQIFLNGATLNRIDYNTNGTGAPAFTTRSAGTKVTLYPALSGSTADYALGIDSATLWSSVPEADASFKFKWYGGENEVANLSGLGAFTAASNITGANILTGGYVTATGNVTSANLALTSGIIDGPAAGRITINGSDIDTDFAVDGDTVANVFYVDAGTGTASFGSATQTVNAVVAFNSTNSILAPVGNTAQRPATGVTGMVRFNTTNNNLELYDNSQWTAVGVPEFTVITNEQFFGDGSTVAFTLGSTQTTNSCIVSINGVVQIPITAYSVSGTDPTCVLTFTEAPAEGDAIEVRQITTTTSVTSISNASGNAVVSVSETAALVNVTGDLSVTGSILGGNINSTAITNGTSNMSVIASGGNIRANIGGTTVQTISPGLVEIIGDLSVSGNATLSGNILGDRIQNGTTSFDIQTPSGNANINIGGTGNLAVFSPGVLNMTGNITPTANITYDLGTTTNRWKDIWLANSTIYLGNSQISANATSLILTNPSGGQTVLSGASPAITGATVSVTGNITGGNLSVSTGNITGGNLLLSGAIEDSGQLDIRTTASNGNIVLTPNGSGNVNIGANIMPTANATANIGSATSSFNTIFAKATSAQYADLAEKYTADAEYASGTVVVFGGTHEVTVDATDADRKVAGVVSTNPSYIMNGGLEGEHVATVALTGRVPCQVVGTVRKGDMMVTAGNGKARSEADPRVGTVIGKALEDFDGTEGIIEVVVGRF